MDKIRLKKCASFLLAIFLIGILSGCSKKIVLTKGLKENEIIRIGGNSYNDGQMKLLYAASCKDMSKTFGADILDKTFGNVNIGKQMKEQVIDNVTDLLIMKAMSKQNGIELTRDEKEALKQAATEYFNSLDSTTREELKVTEDDIYELYEDFAIAIRLYKSYIDNLLVEISDSKARVIKVQSIFLKTYTMENGVRVDYEQEKKQEVKAKAQELLDMVTNGNDFSTIAHKYTEDDKLQYVFGMGDMVEEYEKAAFSLSNGEISQVIETADGYYIIKCINDYMETETNQNKKAMVEMYKRNIFLDEYKPFKNKQLVEINKIAWEKLDIQLKNINIIGFLDKINSILEA